MTPEELEDALRHLLSGVIGETGALEYVRDETLECLEETRAEDVLNGQSSCEPFANVLTWSIAGDQAPFVLTVFRRDTVACHVGLGPPKAILEIVVHSERSEVREVESGVLMLATSVTSATFLRPLFERWLAR